MYLAEEIQNKWAPVLDHDALGTIKDQHRRSVTAVMLENTEKALRESAAHGDYQTLTETSSLVHSNLMGASSSTQGTGGIDTFDPVLISLVRRAMPNLIAYDICGVQPMTGPTGLIFAMRSRYANTTSYNNAGAETFYNEVNTAFSSVTSGANTFGNKFVGTIPGATNTTPLTAVAGTVLLTCQSNRFSDSSANNLTVTTSGSPLVYPANPFTTRYDYSASYYSTYFDGNADYLTVPSATANPLGTTYTIECWHYRTGTASSGAYTSVMQLACTNAYGTSVTGFMLTYDGSSAFNFRDSSSSIVLTYSSTNLAVNTWYHVAVVRNGSGSNNMAMYINGVSVATGTSSGTQTTQTAIYIGGDGSANCSFPGLISNFRITKGQALYTATFTPATSPLTTTSQGITTGTVSLLTCQSSKIGRAHV